MLEMLLNAASTSLTTSPTSALRMILRSRSAAAPPELSGMLLFAADDEPAEAAGAGAAGRAAAAALVAAAAGPAARAALAAVAAGAGAFSDADLFAVREPLELQATASSATSVAAASTERFAERRPCIDLLRSYSPPARRGSYGREDGARGRSIAGLKGG